MTYSFCLWFFSKRKLSKGFRIFSGALFFNRNKNLLRKFHVMSIYKLLVRNFGRGTSLFALTFLPNMYALPSMSIYVATAVMFPWITTNKFDFPISKSDHVTNGQTTTNHTKSITIKQWDTTIFDVELSHI